jgi:glycosyltransferase involved in cell wall biosynthesis
VRICFLCYRGNMYCGGQGIYMYYLTRELRRLGHEVDVMVGPPYPEIAEGIRVHKLPSLNLYDCAIEGRTWLPQDNPYRIFSPANLFEFMATKMGMFPEMLTFSLRAYQKVRQLLPEYRFDVVHDNQCLAYGLLLIRALNIPVVDTIHHPLPIDLKADIVQARHVFQAIRQCLFYPPMMQGLVARMLDRVIVDSESSAEEVSRVFRVPDHKMRLVYVGVDTDVFRGVDGRHKTPNSLIVVGRTEDRKKGILYLLQALRLLKSENVDVKLTVVDYVFPDNFAPRLVREYGLEDVVRFTGRISTEELVREYSKAEVAVTASVYEGFGLPAAEAMACEVPVIATRAGALPEVVKDGETGLLVPPHDAAALAAAIKQLQGDQHLRRRLGGNGRKRVQQCFSWELAAKQTLSVYEEAISKSGRV